MVDSAITYSGDRWAGGGTLTFPTSTSGVANGFYGGNIHIGVIPGPGALAVLGLAGVIAPRRRRR